MMPLVLEQDAETETLRFIEIEATDDGELLITYHHEDCVHTTTEYWLWPAAKAAAICAAIMAAARSATPNGTEH